MKLRAHLESWALRKPFRISRETYLVSDVLVVEVEADGYVGRGEAGGVDNKGDTPAAMLAAATAFIASGTPVPGRHQLAALLPAAGFRNALDAALWDMEAKQSGRRAWEIAGIASPRPLPTFITLGIDTPDAMAADAAALPGPARIKIKLGDAGDVARLRAIRAACPDAILIVDANQGWSFEGLQRITPDLVEVGVQLIEQPIPETDDNVLRGYRSPIPLCADESCTTRASLPALVGKYDYINIKLDKAGGLTEALLLAEAARLQGFRLMVGCMSATSLGIAPGFIVGQQCDIVDLDWHLLNQIDRRHGFAAAHATLRPFDAALWG